ncbi:MAG: ABC transporter substrate-binding protein [bacterium]
MPFFGKLIILIHLTAAALSNRGIFTEGLVGQPLNFVPHLGRQTVVDRDISQILYPQLVEYNLRGDLVPSLAEKWEISDNFLEYSFKLKEGVYWSNNREITGDDIIFTAQNTPGIKNVEVQKISEYEVKFFLKEPFAPFLDLLTLKIIPKEASIGLKPITLADYEIVRVVRSGQRVDEVLIHTNSPENDPFGRIEFMRFKFYDREDDLETAAKLKEIDALYSKNLADQRFFKFDFPQNARRYGVFFNLNSEKFKNSAMRQDLATIIDKNEIINKALNGLGEPVDFFESGAGITPNANYNTEIVLTVPNDTEHLEIAALLKDYWSQIGITAKILPLPFWDISTRVIDTSDFEILLFGQEKGRDPDEYTLWHSTKTRYPGLNISQLNNQRVDDALEKGRREMDPEKREAHYENFITILREEMPAVFLYRPVYRWYISQKYADLFEKYLLLATCCDGCECKEPLSPDLYYPWERFNLLPI